MGKTRKRKDAPAASKQWPGLDPAKPKDARRILKEFSEIREPLYSYQPKWGNEIPGALTRADHAVLDAAFRTAGVPVESGDPAVILRALPGREAEMGEVAKKMGRIKSTRPAPKKAVPKTKPRFCFDDIEITRRRPMPSRARSMADRVLAIRPATAQRVDQEDRYALMGCRVDGRKLVVTDGKRLWMAEGDWGPDGVWSIDAEGRLVERPPDAIKTFPKYADVIPKGARKTKGALAEVDLARAVGDVRLGAMMASEESYGVRAVLNPDGSLGFSSRTLEEGEAEANVQPGHRELFTVNPDYLRQQLEWHWRMGDDAVYLDWEGPARPITTWGNRGRTLGVLMPFSTV